MTSHKTSIQRAFDGAHHTYDKVCDVQNQSIQMMIDLLRDCKIHDTPRTILDVGAGTGNLTQALLHLFPHAHFTLNDISPQMLNVCCAKFQTDPLNRFDYDQGDMDFKNFPFHDLIMSNLALQWADDLPSLLVKLYAKTNILLFSHLTFGTFQELSRVFQRYGLNPVKNYPKAGQLDDLFKDLNPDVFVRRNQPIALDFDNFHQFLKYLKNLGASTGPLTCSTEILKQLIQELIQKFSITYHIETIMVQKIFFK